MSEQLYPFLKPFFKSRYFPQKRLCAKDFIRDQQFVDDKSSFLTHWTLGEGIALGLNIQRLDSHSLLVEPGFAVDAKGRLLLVDKTTVCHLQALDGFHQLSGDNAILWMRYQEQFLEPTLTADGKPEKAVTQEGVTFSLQSSTYLLPPAMECSLFSDFVLFEDSELRITQSIPNILSGSEPTALRLILECYEPEGLTLDLVYEPKILGFSNVDGQTAPKLQCCGQKLNMGETVLFLPIMPTAAGQSACVYVEEEDLKLKKHDRSLNAQHEFRQEFPVSSENIAQAIETCLTAEKLQEAWNTQQGEGVPIAYLRLLRTDQQCLLDEVVPIGERYRTTPPWLREGIRQVSADTPPFTSPVPKPNPQPAPEPQPVVPYTAAPQQMATGTVTLSGSLNQSAGSILRSEEIAHGLGPGNVFVDLGIENKIPTGKNARNRTELLLGDTSLFSAEDGAQEIAMDYGIRVRPERGTFEIAVRLHENLRRHSLSLRWFAWMPEYAPKPAEETGTLSRLDPDIIRIAPGESVMFTPIFTGGASAPCDFFVEGRNSGSITQNGTYTAPGHSGLFLIYAEVRGKPERRADAFVIVDTNTAQDTSQDTGIDAAADTKAGSYAL